MVSATDDIDTGGQADGIVVALVNLAAVCVVNFQSQILRVVQRTVDYGNIRFVGNLMQSGNKSLIVCKSWQQKE
jgi:hypothetical protein